MKRILALDYGKKRSGLAVTDPLRIIVSPLDSVATEDLMDYLERYCMTEDVEKIVIGMPVHADGEDTYLSEEIRIFGRDLGQKIKGLEIVFFDESFSSAKAKEVILRSGLPKMKRRDKSRVDRVSAAIILQEYLGHY